MSVESNWWKCNLPFCYIICLSRTCKRQTLQLEFTTCVIQISWWSLYYPLSSVFCIRMFSLIWHFLAFNPVHSYTYFFISYVIFHPSDFLPKSISVRPKHCLPIPDFPFTRFYEFFFLGGGDYDTVVSGSFSLHPDRHDTVLRHRGSYKRNLGLHKRTWFIRVNFDAWKQKFWKFEKKKPT
jgi:hypothetical protein